MGTTRSLLTRALNVLVCVDGVSVNVYPGLPSSPRWRQVSKEWLLIVGLLKITSYVKTRRSL